MKKVMIIFGAILFASTILTSCSGRTNSNSDSERFTVPSKTCKVCFQSYTGSGYQAFGEEFCSMKCYVDK